MAQALESAGLKSRLRDLEQGGADDYLEAVSELAEVGVTWVMAEPPHRSRAQYLEHVQWFGEEVIAKLRG